MEGIMNTSRKFLLLTGFLFLLLAILSVSALAKKPAPPPDPIPATHEIVYEERVNFGDNLVLVDAGGTNKTVLLQGDRSVSYYQSKFSPDGSQIVCGFLGDDINGLCTINVDGTGFLPITARLGGAYRYPTYATVPIDGQLMILYVDDGVGGDRDLFMVPADGIGEPIKITESPDIWESRASMSADGTFSL